MMCTVHPREMVLVTPGWRTTGTRRKAGVAWVVEHWREFALAVAPSGTGGRTMVRSMRAFHLKRNIFIVLGSIHTLTCSRAESDDLIGCRAL